MAGRGQRRGKRGLRTGDSEHGRARVECLRNVSEVEV
jgi:hypothetical protein